MICESGQIKFPWYCTKCKKRTTIYEPKDERVIYTLVFDMSGPLQCERCGKQGAELHHWSPRKIFGAEAEEWPQSFLCQKCHLEWHWKVTPQIMKNHLPVTP
jgi:hypothetical protein